MVARLSPAAPVLIVDLDGTLLSVNSYPRWASRLARGDFPHLPRRRRMAVAIRSAAVLASRRLRLIGHDRSKWRLQGLWQAAVRGDGGAAEAALRDELGGFVRPEFATVLAAIRDGGVDAILATAAAAEYAESLGRTLGFQHVLAGRRTIPFSRASSPGERKLRAVMALLEAQGWRDRPRILFTDHPDDLPLVRVCATTFWFGSDADREVCERTVPNTAFYSPGGEAWALLLRSLAEAPRECVGTRSATARR